MTNMARPIAASPAATVSTNMEKTCPTRSPRKALNATRLMFTASNINSIAIRIMMMFLRSEEHTSELQSLMRISYAVFCLKKKNKNKYNNQKVTEPTYNLLEH